MSSDMRSVSDLKKSKFSAQLFTGNWAVSIFEPNLSLRWHITKYRKLRAIDLKQRGSQDDNSQFTRLHGGERES